RKSRGHSELPSSVPFKRAGLRRRAFETALSGAREASRMSAHREATDLYRRAVDNIPADLDPAGRGVARAASPPLGAPPPSTAGPSKTCPPISNLRSVA